MRVASNVMALSAVCVLGSLLVGCSKSEPTVITAQPAAGAVAPGGTGAPVKAGNVSGAMKPVAAPPGVQTGLEGGKKN